MKSKFCLRKLPYIIIQLLSDIVDLSETHWNSFRFTWVNKAQTIPNWLFNQLPSSTCSHCHSYFKAEMWTEHLQFCEMKSKMTIFLVVSEFIAWYLRRSHRIISRCENNKKWIMLIRIWKILIECDNVWNCFSYSILYTNSYNYNSVFCLINVLLCSRCWWWMNEDSWANVTKSGVYFTLYYSNISAVISYVRKAIRDFLSSSSCCHCRFCCCRVEFTFQNVAMESLNYRKGNIWLR